MIVIGADTHKSSHTIAAVDAATGKLVATRTVAADAAGQRAALTWGRRLGTDRVWAIEDCRHVSGRLERALVGAGERAVRVAPKLMGDSRRGERQPGKSDEIDALAVARAALRERRRDAPRPRSSDLRSHGGGEDLGVVNEPVDHRGGDDVVAEDLAQPENGLLLVTIRLALVSGHLICPRSSAITTLSALARDRSL